MTSTLHLLTLSNNIAIDLSIVDGFYEGIYQASIDDTPFLVAGRGGKPYFAAPDGVVYTQFRVREITHQTPEGAVIELDALGTCVPVQENRDMFLFPRISARSGFVTDTLRVIFTARQVQVGGAKYAGFAVQYEFSSDSRQIHWIMESVALAPGGTISGARVAAQHMTTNVSPLETILDAATGYATEENYGETCIQSPCRGGGSHLFDLVEGGGLATATYFEHPAALKSSLDKVVGEDFLNSSDFHYGTLDKTFRTEPRIVVAAGVAATTREGYLNSWTAWRDFTSQAWQEALGITPTPIRRVLGFDGTGEGGVDPGQTYSTLLTDWAARLDWVVAQGFDAILLHTPEWRGAANEKTVLFPGNNCCPFEFTLSDHLGGEAGLKAFCDAAHAHGIKVFVWIAGHLAREAPVWKEHPEWIVRNQSGIRWDAHYASIHAFSFVHGGREWLFDALRHLREVTGVDGVWFDSFTNMCMQAINYQSPGYEPNMPAVLSFLGDLSNLGYEIMIECMSQLGISSWGNWKPATIAGQEEMLYGTSLRTYLREWLTDPAYTEEYYFRSLAAGGPIGLWFEEFEGRPTPFPPPLPTWLGRLNAAFALVCPNMHTRTLLPDGAGALWSDELGRPSAFFAFRDGEWQNAASGTVPVSAGHIYQISAEGMLFV